MKSVLITGGTGSFGQAFTAELLNDPAIERVAILSRCEVRQAEMAEKFNDARARCRMFIGDVRDRARLRRAFVGVDTVIHAAALKRIEVGHYNPGEMVKTNIGGAQNVIEAAMDAGVAKVVFLSSDKAWQPISPYGQSKALAETLFLNAYQGGTKFAVTRYGNVWNSRGSVVPRWREQLKHSDTVTVTDPNATRFFMRMLEAIGLVQHTLDTMQGGELNIPALPAYRLGDLAEAMGAKMRVIGLPDYEKLHEGMREGRTSDKADRMTVNELRKVLHEDGLHCASAAGVNAATAQSATTLEWPFGDRRSANQVLSNIWG